MRRGLLLLILFSACNNPTPAGAELLNLDVSTKLPAEVVARLGPAKAHQQTIELHQGGRLTVHSRLAAADDGGRYITRIIVEVEDAAGWELSAHDANATPINVGKGTGGAVRMSFAIMVAQRKKSFKGKHLAQSQLRVSWDGAVERL